MGVRSLAVLAFLGLATLALSPAARADDIGKPMANLLQQQSFKFAWQTMMAGEAAPVWVHEYAETLDGPPTPVIPVELDGETYLLGFTCKPNECEGNQLYVLFAPGGRDAWGLLAAPPAISWLGKPNQRIQDALTGSLRK